jgi:hypothetical protein
VGLAAGVYLLVWLCFRFLWKKSEKPPGISLQIFAIALGLWIAARVLYPDEIWLGHLGAVLVFCGALFGWVLFDRIVSVGWLEKRRKVATSGIAAVILGFAMQDLLANVIAGFSIHMTRAYQVGDWLLLGEDGKRAEVTEVTEVNWRSTRLVDNDRISYELPNSEIVKNRIVNLYRPGSERGVRLRIGLDYDTPPALAKEVLMKAAIGAQGVLESPTSVVFTLDFGIPRSPTNYGSGCAIRGSTM